MSARALSVWIASLASALVGAAGCSLLGTGPGQPEGLPHNGVGPYRDLTPDESGNSRPGSRSSAGRAAVLRWVSGSKCRSVSISSSKNSTRTGWSSPIGKTSRIAPRSANSPCSKTVSAWR